MQEMTHKVEVRQHIDAIEGIELIEVIDHVDNLGCITQVIYKYLNVY